MFGLLFGAARRELELAKVLNLYLGTYHRLFTEHGLEQVISTIKHLNNVEISTDSDLLMGFYIRAVDTNEFYFRLIKKGDNGPAIVASGSGPYFGFSVSANLAAGKLEVFCKPSQGVTPSEKAYALASALKQKFGAVDV